MAGEACPATAVVIGNGVVGLSVALAMQDRGVAVTLVAPDAVWRGASWGNAGHIAVEQVEPLASPATVLGAHRRLFGRGGALALPPREIATWGPFALRLMRASRPRRFAQGKAALGAALATAMPAWRRRLADAGAADLLREDGHFLLWETPATAAAGRARWRSADIGTATVRDATREESMRLAALLSVPVAGAIRFAGSGQIVDAAALGRQLTARFGERGGRHVAGLVTQLGERAGRAVATLADGAEVAADIAIVAAGAASAPLVRGTGIASPLIAERGYHIEMDAPDWPADLPPVVLEDRSLIATRFAHGLRLASFVEFARGDAPPDPRKWDRLEAHAAAMGLPAEAERRRWIGARPTLPDYLPAIGRHPRSRRFAFAYGHQHLGLTLAATTGEALAASLCGTVPPFDLRPFDPGRFG